MKADVLSQFETVKVCTHYMYKGEKIDYLPYEINSADLHPVYEDLKGWQIDLTGITDEHDLPSALNRYIAFIENNVQVPISLVSVGPDRKQTILRDRSK